MLLFFGFIVSLFVTMLLIEPLTRVAEGLHIMDLPDARKVHERPIPRSGGLAMAVGVVIPILLWIPLAPAYRAMLSGMVLLSLVGFIDDLRTLGWQQKLAAQIVAAGIVVFYGQMEIGTLGMIGDQPLYLSRYASIPLTMLAIVGVTNAVNLADGLDGLAGGICLLVFATIGYLAHTQGDSSLTIGSAAMAGAIVGFLRFNTYPATIFMGDSGSYLLGFAAAVMSLILTQRPEGGPAPALPLLFLGVPILDTLMVMGERIAAGVSPFKPDKKHLHHRLLALGFTHKEAVTIIYVLHSLLCYGAVAIEDLHFLRIVAIFLGLLAAASLTLYSLEARGWHFKRRPFLQLERRAFFRDRTQTLLVERPFRVLSRLSALYLLVLAALPAALPREVGLACLGLAALLVVLSLLSKGGFQVGLRLSLSVMLTALVYHLYQDAAFYDSLLLRRVHAAFLGVMAVLLASYVKFGQGRYFRVTPLDAITVLMAIVIPTLPLDVVAQYRLGPVAATLIVLFLSFEAVLERLGERWGWLSLSVLAALLVAGVRGLA